MVSYDMPLSLPNICSEPKCTDCTKRAPDGGKIELSGLASLFKRRQFCFKLNALMVVKMDVIINQRISGGKIFDFLPVNTLSLKYRKEIFSHGVVVTVTAS